MRVLFVVSGNNKHYDIAPFIKSQGDSLVEAGVEVSYYCIKGKGAWNYLKNVGELKRQIKDGKIDLIHAHYSFCGWVAVLTGTKLPIVLSLMGDDATGTFKGQNKIQVKSRLLVLLAWGIQFFVDAIVSKSPNIESIVHRKRISYLIPNGVRLDQFNNNVNGYRVKLGLSENIQYVLFLGNKADVNKNFALAEKSVEMLGRPDVKLINPFRINHDQVVEYLNSVDVFLLCSFSEGSPNVVKEAMACNCPMVVTNVGDTAWLVGKLEGCYVATFDPADFAQKISFALEFAKEKKRTHGRERLVELGLDSQQIASRIINVYNQLLNPYKKDKKPRSKMQAV
jgi:hypothetical protein